MALDCVYTWYQVLRAAAPACAAILLLLLLLLCTIVHLPPDMVVLLTYQVYSSVPTSIPPITHTHACRDAEGDVLDPWRLSELLMDLGAMSVSVDDSSLGTKDENPIMHDHVNSKVL